MKRSISVAIASVIALCVSAICVSCSDLTINEVEGSYFLQENTRVVLEDAGYLEKGFDGEIAMGCYGRRGDEESDCVSVLIPKDGYSLDNNRLVFHNSFKAKVRFSTTFYESNGHALTFVHLQQETKVHASGKVANDTAKDFFQVGNVYQGPVSFSFTLDDGTRVRLQMRTVTVKETGHLNAGWL